MILRGIYLPMLASFALLFAISPCFARQNAAASPNQARNSDKSITQSISDSQFARSADRANLAEIKLGQLAEQKGTDATVRDFGKRMVTDHSNAEANLKAAAAKDNIALPANLSAKDQAVYDRLSSLSGQAFDRAYAGDMVADHTTDVSEFRLEANKGKDAAIKSFASQTLPTIEEHLKLAQEMRKAA